MAQTIQQYHYTVDLCRDLISSTFFNAPSKWRKKREENKWQLVFARALVTVTPHAINRLFIDARAKVRSGNHTLRTNPVDAKLVKKLTGKTTANVRAMSSLRQLNEKTYIEKLYHGAVCPGPSAKQESPLAFLTHFVANRGKSLTTCPKQLVKNVGKWFSEELINHRTVETSNRQPTRWKTDLTITNG